MKLENRILLIVKIAEYMNTQILLGGAIKPNNRSIWRDILHTMENHHWQGVLETLNTLMIQNPEIGNLDHAHTVEAGLAALHKWSNYDRIMDMKNHRVNNKPLAWKCLMTIRELYNVCTDTDIPNHDSSRITNTFKELYE